MKKSTKTLLLLFFLAFFSHVHAATLTLDFTDLKIGKRLYVGNEGVGTKIEQGTIMELEVENFPTLLEISELDGRNIVNLKVLWVTANFLEISGFTLEELKAQPAANRSFIEPEEYDSWSNFEWKDNPDFVPSAPFLAAAWGKVQFTDAEYVQTLLDKVPAELVDFWAVKNFRAYLNELDQIGYDADKKYFSHFTAMNKAGERVRYERPADKFVLIDFSSTGCGPCLKAIDKLVELQNNYQNDLEIVTVWHDSQQDMWLKVAKNQKDKIFWTSLRDDSQAIFQKFDVNFFPYYILVRPDGKIVKSGGSMTYKSIVRYLKRKI